MSHLLFQQIAVGGIVVLCTALTGQAIYLSSVPSAVLWLGCAILYSGVYLALR